MKEKARALTVLFVSFSDFCYLILSKYWFWAVVEFQGIFGGVNLILIFWRAIIFGRGKMEVIVYEVKGRNDRTEGFL